MAKENKSKQVSKARRAAKAQKKGERQRTHKTHTGVRFHRPNTQTQKRNGKYVRSARAFLNNESKGTTVDHYAVIRQPLNTEKCLKKMEDENTMVFLVAPTASKRAIKTSFEALYDVKVRTINTLIRPDGKKKAYIKLTGESDALPLANKIGLY